MFEVPSPHSEWVAQEPSTPQDQDLPPPCTAPEKAQQDIADQLKAGDWLSFDEASPDLAGEGEESAEVAPLEIRIDLQEASKGELVVVTYAREGAPKVTAVLCKHVPENGPAIAKAVEECDVVAFEAKHENEAARRDNEEGYTILAARSEGPHLEQWREAICKYVSAKGDDYISTTMVNLLDTDKQIKLIDVDVDHPANEVSEEFAEARKEYDNAINYLAPIEEARAAAFKFVETAYNHKTTKDEIMAGHVQEIIDNLQPQQTETTIGVVVGALHFGIFDSLFEDTPHEIRSQIVRAVHRDTRDMYRALHAYTKGFPDLTKLFVDRALLTSHFAREVRRGEHQPPPYELSRYIVGHLSDTQVQEILGSLRRDLSDPTVPLSERKKKTLVSLRNGYDVYRANVEAAASQRRSDD